MSEESGDETDKLWQSVYDARSKIFEEHFGPMPEYVQKLMSLTGVWPGGALVQLEAPKIHGFVSSSFGLTNPDMPARSRSSQVVHTVKKADGGEIRQTSLNLEPREPRKVPAGYAGYGYEILIVTPQAEKWPLAFLNWIVPLEINEDVDLLDRVLDPETGGVTVESVAISKDAAVDILIEPAMGSIPAKSALPNGSMQLLVATVITREEMTWALTHGRKALAEKLVAAGVGQVSRLDRPSIAL